MLIPDTIGIVLPTPKINTLSKLFAMGSFDFWSLNPDQKAKLCRDHPQIIFEEDLFCPRGIKDFLSLLILAFSTFANAVSFVSVEFRELESRRLLGFFPLLSISFYFPLLVECPCSGPSRSCISKRVLWKKKWMLSWNAWGETGSMQLQQSTNQGGSFQETWPTAARGSRNGSCWF